MDSLFFIIPFVFPGVFIRMVYDRFHPALKEEQSQYKEIVHAFLISTIVIFVNALVIKFYHKTNIMSVESFETYISDFNNLVNFFLITFVLSIVGVPVYKWVIDDFSVMLVNIYRERSNLPQETKHSSPWHACFENKEFSLANRPVGFFKNDVLVAFGYIEGIPAADKEKKDFMLINTWLKDLFEKELERNESEKLFNIIEREYYDIENDILIKFYSKEPLMKYLEDNDCIISS